MLPDGWEVDDPYFYPRPPRGGRHTKSRYAGNTVIFLSTPSARRATQQAGHSRRQMEISIHALREEGDYELEHPGRPQAISIHALREEGDTRQAGLMQKATYFYPRPPRGGRRYAVRCVKSEQKFLSTPSARRATRSRPLRSRFPCYFYPRPPRGGRRSTSSYRVPGRDFYPRPPRGGRLVIPSPFGSMLIFLSTPSARRATLS